MKEFEAEKIGSATSPLELSRKVFVTDSKASPRAGDVVLVKALTESVTYGDLELTNGRLARINKGDLLVGVLGSRRALKGFVGDVPRSLDQGDRLHLLNMGGVIGICTGHHSSLDEAIEVELVGAVCDEFGIGLNISGAALAPAERLKINSSLVFVAGTCMNSGKTVAATELIKQARTQGMRVCGAKLTGVACLRDTLNMQDHGATATASFLDCGLPSTAGGQDLAPVAKSILNYLDSYSPDLIVAELGDGIVGGYGVETILSDPEIMRSVSSFVFCASDYVGLIGGRAVLSSLAIEIDVVAGSVTDSSMGEEFIQSQFGLRAGNARRDGERLFGLLKIETALMTPAPAVAEAQGSTGSL